MIENIRHIGIVTENLEKSLYFYQTLLGFKIESRQLEIGYYIANMLALDDVEVETVKLSLNGQIAIELLFFHSHPEKLKKIDINTIGITHIALTVDNIDNLYQILLDNDIVFNNPPQITNNHYAKVAFCRTLEGGFLELVEIL